MGLQQMEEPVTGEDDHHRQVNGEQEQQGEDHAEGDPAQPAGVFQAIQLIHGQQQGAEPCGGGQGDGHQGGGHDGGGLVQGGIGQIVLHDSQGLVGQDLVQSRQELLQTQVEQPDEVVHAHKQGEQGQDQKIGQGGGRLRHAAAAVGAERLQCEGDGRKGQQTLQEAPPLVSNGVE